jgi:hypothetical protein
MRSVQIYINDKRLDLFGDEQISVNSSSQNISDIAKVFSDFSQTFSVPASANNNNIFSHYYNSDVDGEFKAKNRQPAYIFINEVPFKSGKIQLEGTEIKNGKPEYYSISFMGEIVSLKDKFGDDRLRDLVLDIEHEGTYAEVKNSLTSTALLDVRYPLITSKRIWDNITTIGGAININELFPAVRCKRIIEAIEEKYSIELKGNFWNDNRFKQLYIWWKNAEVNQFTRTRKQIKFPNGNTAPLSMPTAPFEGNEVVIKYIDPFEIDSQLSELLSTAVHGVGLNIESTGSGNVFVIDVFMDGQYQFTSQQFTDSCFYFFPSNFFNIQGLNKRYSYFIRSNNTATWSGWISYTFKYTGKFIFSPSPTPIQQTKVHTVKKDITPFTTSEFVDFQLTAPDITVSDFLAGILRSFNLTCYPLDAGTIFQVEPLEVWYSFGDDVDLTKYTDIESIKVDRPKLYNEISFAHEESKSFLNMARKDEVGAVYGNAREYFGFDGGNFDIKTPFELLLFDKRGGSNLQVAYSLDRPEEYKPIIPKPVLLYQRNESKTVSFYLTDGDTTEQITTYRPFGNETVFNNELQSICFNAEIDTLTNETVENTLYSTYYRDYLQALFDDKTRIVTIKTMLPLRLLNSIKLNDNIIVRDKKYRINEMVSNLTTGEVKFVLISDFKANKKRRLVFTKPIRPVKPIGGTITVWLKPIKGGTINVLTTGGGFLVFNPTLPIDDLAEDRVLEIEVPSTSEDRSQVVTIEYYDEEGNLIDTQEIEIIQEGSEIFLLQEDGSFLLTESINLIRL